MIALDFSNPVQWRVTTRSHDWLIGNELHRLLEGWEKEGFIGKPGVIEAGDDGVKWDMRAGETLAEAILRMPRDPSGGLTCQMRGSSPQQWWMSMILSPFDEQLGHTNGYSIINLNMPRSDCERRERNLVSLFERLHQPQNCDYASVHPEHHAELLRLQNYVPALTIAPMFAGLLWANFLGTWIINEFADGAFDELPVARRHWFGREGVMLLVGEHLGSADSPIFEEKLIALTEELRLRAA